MSNSSTIPDFTNTTDSIGNSLRAVKLLVDRLAGNTQGSALGAPNMYVQEAEPKPGTNVVLKAGDLWIKPESKSFLPLAKTGPAKLYYWSGKIWKTLL